MADKIIASISYIRTVSKKMATIEKILAHLSKSEIMIRHGRLKV